jgi:hypothetical protein
LIKRRSRSGRRPARLIDDDQQRAARGERLIAVLES